uniref:Glutathione S-transferase 1, isoform C n=1 Tax=Lygus hesperus TaxID=30085 RepID=A0A0A9WQ04_LYGHE
MYRALQNPWIVIAIVFETMACPPPPPPRFRSNNPDVYYTPGSPPSGMILMALKVMEVDANLKRVDLANQEQMKPEYLKINPQHTVPAMDDNGFTIGESRAILAYLAEMTPIGKLIYPRCPWKRAKINEMLYFDVGRLYPHFQGVYDFSGKNPSDQDKTRLSESLGMFEEYLSRNGWAATDCMTIADLSLLTTVSLLEHLGYNLSNYTRIAEWLPKMKATVPDYQSVNPPNMDAWKAMYDASRSK